MVEDMVLLQQQIRPTNMAATAEEVDLYTAPEIQLLETHGIKMAGRIITMETNMAAILALETNMAAILGLERKMADTAISHVQLPKDLSAAR